MKALKTFFMMFINLQLFANIIRNPILQIREINIFDFHCQTPKVGVCYFRTRQFNKSRLAVIIISPPYKGIHKQWPSIKHSLSITFIKIIHKAVKTIVMDVNENMSFLFARQMKIPCQSISVFANQFTPKISKYSNVLTIFLIDVINISTRK